MATLNFNVKPLGNGTLQIMAIVRNGEFKKRKYTGFTIPDKKQGKEYKYWATKLQRVKNLDDEDAINSKLNKWQTAFNEYMLECRRIDMTPASDEILALFRADKTVPIKKERMRLAQMAAAYIKAKELILREKSIGRYSVLENQILGFEKDKGKYIFLSDVNKEFYAEFSEWLIRVHNNTNSTVQKKIIQVKTLMHYAFDEGFINTRDYAKPYNLKQVESNRYPLTLNEVEILRNFQTTNLNWRLILDAFLFAVETGLRYSDVKQLNASHIKVMPTQTLNFHYIDFHSTKTDKRNTIPLSENALTILKKYLKNRGAIFQVFTDQFVNEQLKDIFAAAGLNRECEKKTIQGNKQISQHLPLHRLATFHLARHTYATLLILKGVPLKFVQDNMGHSSIKTTMIYTRNSDADRMLATIKVMNGAF